MNDSIEDRIAARTDLAGNSFIEKYQSRIVTLSDSGCMIWMGAVTKKGYGIVYLGEKTKNGKPKPSYAHRASYQSEHNCSSADIVMHSCDVRCCVNPEHLSTGTYKDNSQDMVFRGRSLKGSKQPNSVMTEMDVQQAIFRHQNGETVASIATDMPVHVETVRKAIKGTTWRHVK